MPLASRGEIEDCKISIGIRLPSPCGAFLVKVPKATALKLFDEASVMVQNKKIEMVMHGEVVRRRSERPCYVLSLVEPVHALMMDNGEVPETM